MTTWKPAHNPKTLQATRLVATMLFAVGVIVAVGVIRTLLRSTPDISSTSNNISSVVRDNSGKIFVDHQEVTISCYDNGKPIYPMRACLVPTATPGAP